MNRRETHHLRQAAAALLLCAGLVSCSQDRPACPQGDPLPEGMYPLELSVQGLPELAQPETRATVDNDWEGVGSVAVCVYTRGNEVKRYSVTSSGSGKTAKLTSDAPFWWEFSGQTESVMAWHPYSDSYPSAWTVKADQSTVENYRASDLVMGRNTDVAFDDRNDPTKSRITLTHQPAKVVVNLTAGATVSLDGVTSVQLLNVSGVETGSTITLYRPDKTKHSWCALLNGQDIAAGSPFIRVSTGSDSFIYAPPAATTLNAGTSYTYDITVKADGLEVKEAVPGEWQDAGSEVVAAKTITHYTASDLKIGDYYYSDGTWSDGGLRKLYSDGTMIMESPRPAPVSGKTLIGIVFHAGHHASDQSDYSSTGIGQQKCHGYVVALSDATPLWACKWGVYGTELGCYPKDGSGKAQDNYSKSSDIDWSGYNYTQTIINHVGGKDKLNASEDAGYPATYYAVVAYENETSSSANSSGWFLPSIGQLNKVYQQRNLFDSVVGSGELRDKDYWTSSEVYDDPSISAIVVNMGRGRLFAWSKWSSSGLVRTVLAF